MKKLSALVIAVLAISLLAGVVGSNCLAGPQTLYLPLISSAPPPPPVTPEQFIGSWAVSDTTGAHRLFIYRIKQYFRLG